MNESTKVELLKLAVQIAAQERNGPALTARLAVDPAADSLTVTLAIAQELSRALEIIDTPAKP